jgi:hypothetical protein
MPIWEYVKAGAEAASARATGAEATSAGATDVEAASAGATDVEAASAGATDVEAASAGATDASLRDGLEEVALVAPAQNSPTVRPSSSMSTFSAAGSLPRPGICWMSPQSGTSQPAPV